MAVVVQEKANVTHTEEAQMPPQEQKGLFQNIFSGNNVLFECWFVNVLFRACRHSSLFQCWPAMDDFSTL
jgi:hypothetical protein